MTVTQNQIQYSHDESLEFPFLPPFPKDVPIAPLLRISLKKLLAHDSTEEDNLFRACRELGFFYLDVGSAADDETIDGKLLLKDVDSLFDLSEGIFKLPTKEKQSYDFNDEHSYFGYKGVGDGIIDKEGNPDRNEFWNVSKNDILGISDPIPNPEVLRKEENRALAKSYILRSHAVVTLILRILNDRLGLPEGTLQKHHRLNAISGDQVRWVRFPPQKMDEKQIAFGEHTDFGTLTLLFNRLGGLQIRLPGETEWDYVKPLKGHCVVNIGDALVKFTAGVLRSNIHRVVSPPGEQESYVRDSVVYFNRPEDDVPLKVLDGSALIDANVRKNPSLTAGPVQKANDWILRRAMGRRAGGDFLNSGGTEAQTIAV